MSTQITKERKRKKVTDEPAPKAQKKSKLKVSKDPVKADKKPEKKPKKVKQAKPVDVEPESDDEGPVGEVDTSGTVLCLVDNKVLDTVEEYAWDKPSHAPHAKTQRFARHIQSLMSEHKVNGSCLFNDALDTSNGDFPGVGDVKFSKAFTQAIAAQAELDLKATLNVFRTYCALQGCKTQTVEHLVAAYYLLHNINVDATHHGIKSPERLLHEAFGSFTASYTDDAEGRMHPKAVVGIANYILSVDIMESIEDADLKVKCQGVLALDAMIKAKANTVREHKLSPEEVDSSSAYKAAAKERLKAVGINNATDADDLLQPGYIKQMVCRVVQA
jgi:hypothetical protein